MIKKLHAFLVAHQYKSWHNKGAYLTISTQVSKSKDILGFVQITYKTTKREWLETSLNFRLGQWVPRPKQRGPINWDDPKQCHHVWEIYWQSEHFIEFCRKLSRYHLAHYRVLSEADSGNYIAEGRFLFVLYNQTMF